MKKIDKSKLWLAVLISLAILGVVIGTTTLVWENVNKGLDLKGGFEVLYEADEPVESGVLADAAHVLSRRIDSLGVREPSITVESSNRVRVQLAGIQDPDKAREILKKQAMLTFRDPSGKQILLSGKELKVGGASVGYDGQNKPVVSLQVKEPKKLEEITRKYQGKKMPIYLDDDMVSDPVIQSVITDGTAQITGQRSIAAAKQFADLLNGGAVPIKLKEVQSFAVDASLGEDAMKDTLLATIYGILAICIFVIGYYRLPGVVAIISLIAYSYLVLLAFMLLDVTLTLPGIAAFVLGIGMAVDANVIMYERVREELRKGKSIPVSVRYGSKRSFLTIFDAHVTTLIAAGVLLIFGTAGVKGFAVSLITGILVSFLTAIALARFIMTLLVKSNLLQDSKWFQVKKDEVSDLDNASSRPSYSLDFVKHRNKYFAVTCVTSILAVGALLFQGLNLGIDFVSGTRLDIKFEKQVELDQVKKVLGTLGYENPNVRLGGKDKEVAIFQLDKKLDKVLVDKISESMKQTFNQKIDLQENTIDPVIGRELAQNAMWAILIASIGIVIYISLRFEYRFAVAAIFSLLYDALITIGLFSICQFEVDLVFVAAILTIIGYSITDTIVIFDRIRENISSTPAKSFKELCTSVNNSINQTLTRSINTVLTVVFAASALCIFGGESIRYFSLALLIGIISGAYSSIFIASQAWVAWKGRSMRELESQEAV